MRQIEFRFYDPFNAVMTYSDSARDLMEFFYWYQKTVDGENDPIIMQYTGLKDANGKKIFEGDLVVESIMGERIFSEITYGTGNNMHPCFCYKFRDGSGYDQLDGNDNLTIIGNIYQNKELLNEVKNDSAN